MSYESLDSELARLRERLELPHELRLPRAKGGIRKERAHYSTLMGEAERNLVAEVCAREISLFSYAF